MLRDFSIIMIEAGNSNGDGADYQVIPIRKRGGFS